MSHYSLIFSSVAFGYESSVAYLFKDVHLHLVDGWTGVVGANGSGKSTLLQLATGMLKPGQGAITKPNSSVYCPQRTDDPPLWLAEFLQDSGKDAHMLKSKLAIDDDYDIRWLTLSHGERKRAQIGAALWQQPDLLAIDEPTNHLDAHARELIAAAMQAFSGIGLLVSHDRELLDRLCRACLFTVPPTVILRPGGVTQASEALQKENLARQRQHDRKKFDLQKLQQESIRRREEAQQADKKRSKKHLARHDRDGRAKLDMARVSGKDGYAGKLQRQLQGRLEQLQEEFSELKVEKSHALGIWLPGSFSKRDFLVQIPDGSLALGEKKHLVFPTLLIKPTDRICITGRNGAGKSTLVRHLVKHIKADPEQITYIPQEIDRLDCTSILQQTQSLAKDRLGHVMTIVSRLNSRPERLLESAEPSPGEVRKLLLALGMSRQPHIIIMDEPTNHMDLPSIECLEAALQDCPCALVLVSHDTRFLKKLTLINWHLQPQEDGMMVKLRQNLFNGF